MAKLTTIRGNGNKGTSLSAEEQKLLAGLRQISLEGKHFIFTLTETILDREIRENSINRPALRLVACGGAA
jgi:hypothetical protein